MIAAALALLLSAPPGPLAGAVIVVDPGHGGQSYSRSYTGGTRGVASKRTESELNLLVGRNLADRLRALGATVFVTRDRDRRLSPEGSSAADELHARVDFCEHHNCHFFVSIHHNAGPPTATGHTALYKHNASDDTLYESLARAVNDALAGAVPGPKLKLIKGSYHILRETDIPGTITEAGFMTSAAFDDLAWKGDFADREAAAIAAGATSYWAAHKAELVSLRDKLAAGRLKSPRDPATYTNADLNPVTRERVTKLRKSVVPEQNCATALAPRYVSDFKRLAVTDPKAKFDVVATVEGTKVVLSGESGREPFNRLIDFLVELRITEIDNRVKLPAAQK